ncbi:hypothetical protein V6R21_12080 [Limibacter armeniacum]|uniref:hypothetical protein n=1 Tax=Limibacter armeniacum TaxID=466084 RepID=UPI002FE52AC8
MRKYTTYFLALIFAGLMTACTEDEVLPESETINISVTSRNPELGKEVKAGQEISIILNVTNEDKVKDFIISGSGIEETEIAVSGLSSIFQGKGLRKDDELDKIDGARNFNYTFRQLITDDMVENGDITFNFTAKDGVGEKTLSVEFTTSTEEIVIDEKELVVSDAGEFALANKEEIPTLGLRFAKVVLGGNGAYFEGVFEGTEANEFVAVTAADYIGDDGEGNPTNIADLATAEAGDKATSFKVKGDNAFEEVTYLTKLSSGKYIVLNFHDYASGGNADGFYVSYAMVQ